MANRFSIQKKDNYVKIKENKNEKFLPALITASTLVYSKHFLTSLKYWMLPLAKTGTDTASFTALIWSQLANPVAGPFCSRRRPCTVIICVEKKQYLLILANSSKFNISNEFFLKF